MQLANIGVAAGETSDVQTYVETVSSFGMMDWDRADELDADYFGIQYLYKTGYDTDCFLKALQEVWNSDPKNPRLDAFSRVPPLDNRLKMLHREIDDILPSQAGAITSNPEFDQFIGRLRQIAPLAPQPIKPTLIRHDSSSQ